MWVCYCGVNCCKKSYAKKKLNDWSEEIETDLIAQYDAMIRFYLKVDPNTLEDDDWCKFASEIIFNLKFNGTLENKKPS